MELGVSEGSAVLRRCRRRLIVVPCLSLACVAAPALAQEQAQTQATALAPSTLAGLNPPRVRLAAFVGYGLAAGIDDFQDPFKVGFGLRGGTLLGSSRFYLGGVAAYHLGTRDSGFSSYAGNYTRRSGFGYLTADFGYEYGANMVTLLPYVGVGGAWLRAKSCSDARGCLDRADAPFGAAAAVGLTIRVGERSWFGGLDTRCLLAWTSLSTSDDTSTSVSGCVMYALLGTSL